MPHFCFISSLLRNEMMTYQYFHSPYGHIDAMLYTSTFLSCILDIFRD